MRIVFQTGNPPAFFTVLPGTIKVGKRQNLNFQLGASYDGQPGTIGYFTNGTFPSNM